MATPAQAIDKSPHASSITVQQTTSAGMPGTPAIRPPTSAISFVSFVSFVVFVVQQTGFPAKLAEERKLPVLPYGQPHEQRAPSPAARYPLRFPSCPSWSSRQDSLRNRPGAARSRFCRTANRMNAEFHHQPLARHCGGLQLRGCRLSGWSSQPGDRPVGEVDRWVRHVTICRCKEGRALFLFRTGCSSAWLERYVRDVEVAGSNPVIPTQLDFEPFGEFVKRLSLFQH